MQQPLITLPTIPPQKKVRLGIKDKLRRIPLGRRDSPQICSKFPAISCTCLTRRPVATKRWSRPPSRGLGLLVGPSLSVEASQEVLRAFVLFIFVIYIFFLSFCFIYYCSFCVLPFCSFGSVLIMPSSLLVGLGSLGYLRLIYLTQDAL